jgi:hypothetical protein
VLEAQDVLYVPELKKNLLSVSALEDEGFSILFQNEQALIHSEGASLNIAMSIGVREGKPVSGSKGILDHGSMSMAEDEEQEASKGEQSSQNSSVGSQPSDAKRELAPSNSFRRPSWYEMTLMDAQEHEEAPRSTDRESRPPKKWLYFRALMCNVIDSKTSSVQGVVDQQGWRDANV